MRLFDCPVTSVSCERAFSTMNLTHTKHRNRLSVEKVDMLCFIHINRKILDRSKAEFATLIKKRLEDLSIEEAVELETTILEEEIRVDLEAMRPSTW
jgi:hypothetical protein